LKILATFYKEFLLLIRDVGGMAVIFLMPLALVIVMALVQDAPFRDYQELKLDVIFVDQDQAELGRKLSQSFAQSTHVRLISKNDSSESNRLVRNGTYKAAIILPTHASAALQEKTRQLIARVLHQAGLPTALPDSVNRPAVGVTILFDPAIKSNYKQALTGAVSKIFADVQTQWVIDELQSQLTEGESTHSTMQFDPSQMIQVVQKDAGENRNKGIMMNSVQHNVPAWTMFAMFFIVFPLAGNFIKEREEGSMLRLRLIGGSQLPVMVGKFLFYFTICLAQFVLMILVGIFVMPLLGLNSLELGDGLGMIVTACAVAIAATGYGLVIAVFFKTPQQALSFGSVSVVILSALGGVWVPVYVMPEFLQMVSRFSPLQWGLESFNDLFLRHVSVIHILPNIAKLLFFGLAALILSVLIHRSRTIS
jgi:ABC-2 type transport system permease protein